MALIQDVQETRHHGNNRSSFVVRIHDGSLDDATQKVKAMLLRVFVDTAPTETGTDCAALWKSFLEEHSESKRAVSFFCISGSQGDDSKFCFRTTRNTIIDKGVSAKADKLNSDAALHSLQVQDTVAFDLQAPRSARDWSKEPGTETTCKLFNWKPLPGMPWVCQN